MDCPGFQVIYYGIYDSRIAYPKQMRTQPRLLNRFELELYAEELSGTSYIDDVPHPLKKGLFICAKPGQRRYSQLPTRCYYIHLITQDPGLTVLLQSLPDSCRLSELTAVQQAFQDLVSQPYPQSTAEALQVQSLVCRLLSLVSRQTARELHTDATVRRSHRAMMIETEGYIRSHLAEPLTLEQLSQRAKFSPSHFHTVFTAWFGMPPHQFVSACRIEAAKAALRSDRSSMIEIASDCGFSSQAHFCAQFKRATGQTPLQYRKVKLSKLAL